MKTKIKIFLIIFLGLFFNQLNQTNATDFEVSQNFTSTQLFIDASWPLNPFLTLQSFDKNSLTNSGILVGGYFLKSVGDYNDTAINIYSPNGELYKTLPLGYNASYSPYNFITIDTQNFVYILLRSNHRTHKNAILVFDKYSSTNPFYLLSFFGNSHEISKTFNGFFFSGGLPFLKYDNTYYSFNPPNLELGNTGSIVELTGRIFTESINSLVTTPGSYTCSSGNVCYYINFTNNTLNSRVFGLSNNILNFNEQSIPLPIERQYYNYGRVAYLDSTTNKIGLSFADTNNKKVSSYAFSNGVGSWSYFPNFYIHYYDYNKKNAFLINDYGTGTNQVPYTFNSFGVNTILKYSSGPLGDGILKYYIKENSNSIWSNNFEPNLDGLSIYTGSILPDGPTNPDYQTGTIGPNYNPISNTGTNTTTTNNSDGTSSTSTTTTDNSWLGSIGKFFGNLGGSISSGFSSLTSKLDSLFGGNVSSVGDVDSSGTGGINSESLNGIGTSGNGAIGLNVGNTLNPIVQGDLGDKSCRMFGDNGQFLYYSNGTIGLNFQFGNYNNYFLDGLSFIGEKMVGILVSPINSAFQMIMIITPFGNSNKDYCIMGSIVTYEPHKIFKGTIYYNKMTIFDYFVLLAFGIFLISFLLSIKNMLNPYSGVSAYTEEKGVTFTSDKGTSQTQTITNVKRSTLKHPEKFKPF